jgi:hypothetical protein
VVRNDKEIMRLFVVSIRRPFGISPFLAICRRQRLRFLSHQSGAAEISLQTAGHSRGRWGGVSGGASAC